MKGNEYLIRLMRNGREKLVVMTMENYVAEGRTQEAISAGHLDSHEEKAKSVRAKLTVRVGG